MASSSKLLEQFKRQLDFSGLATRSIYGYSRIIERFLEYSGGDYSKASVIDFIQSDNWEDNSRAYYFKIIKRFFEALGWDWEFAKREGPRTKVTRPPAISEDDAGRLLALAKKRSPLDFAMFRILAITCMRDDELCRLSRANYKRPELTIDLGKGELYRTMSLDTETTDALDAYLATREDESPALFVGEKTLERIRTEVVYHKFKRYARLLKFDQRKMGTHSIRRGVTTWLSKGGMSLKEIQEFGGWLTIEMPARYIRLGHTEVEEKAKKVHPLIKRGE